jgi:SAM-dependent methyltransferase
MGHCVRGLYEEGRHYDLLMPGPNDLAFYESQVKKYGEPVLELACGTGRLTIPLRVAGTDITGLDNAPAMLQVARDKAERSGIAIQYVHADARAYSLDRLFRLIFIANNSLSHLLRREEVEACFRCVRQHLAPDGRFIVDLFTPSVHILARDPVRRYPVGEYEDPDGRSHITVAETNRYDPATQVNHITWHYQRNGEPEAWDVSLNLRMFYPQEIEALLIYNGFVIEHKYGDFEETPYGPGSPKQLIVCRGSGLA